MSPLTRYVCMSCGVKEHPCHHFPRDPEIGQIEKTLRVIEHGILEIIHLLNRPQSATLKLQTGGWNYLVYGKLRVVIGGSMPASIAIGGTASSLFQEWSGPNGTGTVLPNAGAPAFASDNTAVATVDPASGVVTGVSAGTANISGTDSVNNLAASDVITVTAPAAQSATLTLTAN